MQWFRENSSVFFRCIARIYVDDFVRRSVRLLQLASVRLHPSSTLATPFLLVYTPPQPLQPHSYSFTPLLNPCHPIPARWHPSSTLATPFLFVYYPPQPLQPHSCSFTTLLNPCNPIPARLQPYPLIQIFPHPPACFYSTLPKLYSSFSKKQS